MASRTEGWLPRIAAVWVGAAITMFATSAASYAMVWYITENTGSPFMLAVTYVCAFLPMGLLSPFGGIAADRFNRRTLVMLCDLGIAVSAAAFGAPLMTLIQKNIAPEKLGRAMGLYSAMTGLAIPIGTAIGGVLAEIAGIPAFFVASGVFMLGVSLFIWIPRSVRALDVKDCPVD